MNFARSALAIAVTAALLLASLCIPSLALGTPTGTEDMDVTVSLSNTVVKPGDVITVTVSIANNYYASSLQFPVLFPSASFELVASSEAAPINASTVNAIEGSLDCNTTAADFLPVAYSSDDYSGILLQWIAGVSNGYAGVYKQESGAACFTFQLTVLDGVANNDSIFIPADYEDFYNQAMNNPQDGTTVYYIPNMSTVLSLTPAKVLLAPELVSVTGYNLVINDTANTVCGFTLPADGTFTFADEYDAVNGTVITKAVDGVFGTGTAIMLLDANGKLYKSYNAIIYGDATGDGLVDTSDISLLRCWLTSKIVMTAGSPAAVAADANRDGVVDSNDVTLLAGLVNGTQDFAALSQVPVT